MKHLLGESLVELLKEVLLRRREAEGNFDDSPNTEKLPEQSAPSMPNLKEPEESTSSTKIAAERTGKKKRRVDKDKMDKSACRKQLRTSLRLID